jgi:hypothetical protein
MFLKYSAKKRKTNGCIVRSITEGRKRHELIPDVRRGFLRTQFGETREVNKTENGSGTKSDPPLGVSWSISGLRLCINLSQSWGLGFIEPDIVTLKSKNTNNK